jgi:hypothetical protein
MCPACQTVLDECRRPWTGRRRNFRSPAPAPGQHRARRSAGAVPVPTGQVIRHSSSKVAASINEPTAAAVDQCKNSRNMACVLLRQTARQLPPLQILFPGAGAGNGSDRRALAGTLIGAVYQLASPSSRVRTTLLPARRTAWRARANPELLRCSLLVTNVRPLRLIGTRFAPECCVSRIPWQLPGIPVYLKRGKIFVRQLGTLHAARAKRLAPGARNSPRPWCAAAPIRHVTNVTQIQIAEILLRPQCCPLIVRETKPLPSKAANRSAPR